MNEELKTWLHELWIRDNIKKYHCYFEPWFSCLTESQLHGFGEQKRHIEEGSLVSWITK